MTTTPVPNGGFETAGTEPGDASGWSFTEVNSLEEYAGFSVGAFDVAWEGFELGWDNDDFMIEFEPADVEAALFDDGVAGLTVQEFEDFEEGWLGNQDWSDELVSTAFAVFDSGTSEPFEDFEEEWDSNEDWRRYFSEPGFRIASGDVTAGWYRVDLFGQEFAYQATGAESRSDVAEALKVLIDAAGFSIVSTRFGGSVFFTPIPKALDIGLIVEGPAEDTISIVTRNTDEDLEASVFNTTTDDAEGFEREWRSNENFEFSLGATETAVFDSVPQPFEDFEDEWPTEQMQTIF